MTRAMPLVIAAVKEDLVEENEKVSSFPLNYLLKLKLGAIYFVTDWVEG